MDLRLNQYFIVAQGGTLIAYTNLSGNLTKDSIEIFNDEFASCTPAPVFHKKGITFFWLKNQVLYFVFTTTYPCSPFQGAEFLENTVAIFKDYIGSLSEAAFKANFFLVDELLAEVCTFGFVQESHNRNLKRRIVSNPVCVDGPGVMDILRDRFNKSTRSCDSVNRSILSNRLSLTETTNFTNAALENLSNAYSNKNAFLNKFNVPIEENEIYLDVYEALQVTQKADDSFFLNRLVGKVYTRSFLAFPIDCMLSFIPILTPDAEEKAIEEATPVSSQEQIGNLLSTNSERRESLDSPTNILRDMFSTTLAKLGTSEPQRNYLLERSKQIVPRSSQKNPNAFSRPSFIKKVFADNVFLNCHNSSTDTTSSISEGKFEFPVQEGEHLLFEYVIDDSNKNKKCRYEIPLNILTTLETSPDAPTNFNLSIILQCNIPSGLSCQNVELVIDLPPSPHISSVIGRAMENKDKTFEYTDETGRAMWKIKSIKGGDKEILKIVIGVDFNKDSENLAEKMEMFKNTFSSLVMKYDYIGSLASGMKINSLTPTKGDKVNKWVRYHTVCEFYEKRIV